MRFPVLRTLSARIIVGFTVLILTFGGVSAVTVLNLQRLSAEIRVIRLGYLELALIAKDLAEKQNRMRAYLMDDLVGESTPGRVQAHIRRFRAARKRLLAEAEKTLEDLDDVPRVHVPTMKRSQTHIRRMRADVATLAPLYTELLAAPPLDRMATAPGISDTQRAELRAASTALKLLRRKEGQLYTRVWQFEREQRIGVESTARHLERGSGRVRLYTIYLGLIAILVGLLITMWAILTLRPLRRLHDAARRIASGNYGSRIEERGAAEIADLAREFNIMGHAIEERERQVVRSERLVAVGKMAAMITHEIRNPLSSIGLNTELLEDELAILPADRSDEARALCRAINTEIDRLTAITEEYLQFARLPKPKLREEDVNVLVRDLTGFEREQLALRDVTLSVDLQDALPSVLIDDAQIRQALRNLMRNATEALEEQGGGHVEVATARQGGLVLIRVSDDGPGISEELAPKLFDPFVSTKSGGTGLGLALSHQIAHEHGGTIRVVEREGPGATFVIELPAAVPCDVDGE